MRGFRVHLAEGGFEDIEGTHYEVRDDGALVVLVEHHLVAVFSTGSWGHITDLGVPLSDTWPHPSLNNLLDSIADLVVVGYGGEVSSDFHSPDVYSSPLMNDVESFTAAVLSRTDIGADSCNEMDREQASEVRRLIDRAFSDPAG